MIKNCKICDNEFNAISNAKTCGVECKKQNHKNKIYKQGLKFKENIKNDEYRDKWKITSHNYYLKNKEQIQQYNKNYYLENRQKCLDGAKNFYINNKDELKILRTNNQKNINQKNKIKYKTDKIYNFKVNYTNSIRQRLRFNKVKKLNRFIELTGCAINILREHLEKQFKEGMTWENYGYGNNKWHIDHIIGVCNFDLSKLEEQQKCFHYTNLQPLWQPENFAKQRYIEREIIVENR